MNKLNNTKNEVKKNTMPYLLFTIGDTVYGIGSEFVRSIERLGEIINIAESKETMRGGVLYQNKFIYLIDMRKLLGLDTQIEEFEKLVKPEQRIIDHEKWLSALEKSVKDHTEFLLTDDPRKCDFGKWYYAFKTENNVLKHQLHAIESPHKYVHSTAKIVNNLLKENNYEKASSVIKEMKATHYKTTLHILSGLREIVVDSLKEIYIVIDSTDSTKGIIVDSIVGVEYIEDILQIPESMQDEHYIKCLGRRKNSNDVVIIINDSI